MHTSYLNSLNLQLILLIFLINNSLTVTRSYQETKRPFTIMLNPSGDTKDTGRDLNYSFERGITLQFCQELKKNVENNYKFVRVILTRVPGETIEQMQNANFSNRLDADFFLSIHFYKENAVLPRIFLFNYINKPLICLPKIEDLYFYQYDDAYLININTTIKYGNKIKNSFTQYEYKNKFDFKGFFSIPFKPLIGIKAPSIGLEIGLKKIEWDTYLKPILQSIEEIINL